MNTDISYLGMCLPHPFIAGASPFGYHVDSVKRLEDAGCAAVVLHSLFEEQVSMRSEERSAPAHRGEDELDEVAGYFPRSAEYHFGPDEYAAHLHRITQAVKIPVIGSLNVRRGESWLRFAQVIEQAGAAALELNWYQVNADMRASGAAIEHQLIETVRELKRVLKIPIAVKISPFFTALANVAHELDDAGADGLVLFNRFYQPEIDIRAMAVVPRVELSTSAELLLRLRWVAILYGRVRSSIAVTGGVATPHDGIKAVLAGADAVQMVSALLHHGPSYVTVMRDALEQWLDWHGMVSLTEVRGRLSLRTTQDPEAYERANYIRTLQSWGH